MSRAILALLLAGLPAVAAAQPQPGGFHDCYRVTDATYAVAADADGLALRLGGGVDQLYPARAMRMQRSAEVDLSCAAVSEHPIHCTILRETLPGFGFGAAAVRLAQASRLTGPAGVWPMDVVVTFRRTPLTKPIVSYC